VLLSCFKAVCPLGNTPEAIFTFSSNVLPCSGNGRCLSLRQRSLYSSLSNFQQQSSIIEYTDWDADRIYGCLCEPGWSGVACEIMECPYGDDPLTTKETEGNSLNHDEDEVQLIDCQCNNCAGGVYLSLFGENSVFIPYNAEAELIRARLEELYSIGKVVVSTAFGSGVLCSVTGAVTMVRNLFLLVFLVILFVSFILFCEQIKFLLPLRSTWPSLTISPAEGLQYERPKFGIRSKGQYSLIDTRIISSSRTREFVECNNRGICDRKNGVCQCFPGFASSNGMGSPGTLGDCGYLEFSSLPFYYQVGNVSFSTNCPVGQANQKKCSGHGECLEVTGSCICNSGYGKESLYSSSSDLLYDLSPNPLDLFIHRRSRLRTAHLSCSHFMVWIGKTRSYVTSGVFWNR
jgi:hypothetical protein